MVHLAPCFHAEPLCERPPYGSPDQTGWLITVRSRVAEKFLSRKTAFGGQGQKQIPKKIQRLRIKFFEPLAGGDQPESRGGSGHRARPRGPSDRSDHRAARRRAQALR